MKITATNKRSEIISRLREIVSTPDATFSPDDSFNTCDFFMDDLAYFPPYESMMGAVLYPNEVGSFTRFMALVTRACREIGSRSDVLEGTFVEELQAVSRNLLELMTTNNNAGREQGSG